MGQGDDNHVCLNILTCSNENYFRPKTYLNPKAQLTEFQYTAHPVNSKYNIVFVEMLPVSMTQSSKVSFE